METYALAIARASKFSLKGPIVNILGLQTIKVTSIYFVI